MVLREDEALGRFILALFDEEGFIPKARRFFGGSCVGSLWCCLMKNLMRGFVLVLIKKQGSGKVLRKLDFRVMGGWVS